MNKILLRLNIGLAAVAALLLLTIIWSDSTGDAELDDAAGPMVTVGATSTTSTTTTTTTTEPPYEGWVDPASSGLPWGDTVEGILTFRGNPTRSYYGGGPVPAAPEVVWRFPEDGAMCSNSSVGSNVINWCGSGWTGQPSIFERDGNTWVAVGAYSRNVHFLDADDGS